MLGSTVDGDESIFQALLSALLLSVNRNGVFMSVMDDKISLEKLRSDLRNVPVAGPFPGEGDQGTELDLCSMFH